MPTRSQSANLTPDTYTHALTTLQSLYDSYVAPTLPVPLQSALDTLFTSAIAVQPYIMQLTSLMTSLVSSLSGSSGGSAESTALISTAVLIITLYISLRVFNYVRRMVIGWIFFVVKVVVVLVGVQVLVYVNRYGWENAIRDASWWGGIIWGFIEEVLNNNDNNTGGAGRARSSPRGTRSRRNAGRNSAYNAQGQAPLDGGRMRWT